MSATNSSFSRSASSRSSFCRDSCSRAASASARASRSRMRSRSSARTIPVSRHTTSSEIATSAVTTAGISRLSPRTYWMSSTAAGDSIAAVSRPIRQ